MVDATMRRTMKYNITVAWDDADDIWIARVAELPSIAAHGSSVEAALVELAVVLGAVLEELGS